MKVAVLYKTGQLLVIEEGIKIPPLQPGQALLRFPSAGYAIAS